MKPVQFRGSNVTIGEGQPEYLPLPAHLESGKVGRVVSCWRMSWRERLKVLLTGCVWHEQLTFNQPMQPVAMGVDAPEITAEMKLSAERGETGNATGC